MSRGQGGSVDARVIRADFDRIAALPEDAWDHNTHYHSYLLKQLPARCEAALDLGCGTGAFARALARRADHVLALDLSPRMIEMARERSRDHGNIEFQVADALQWDWPVGRFDCIVSVATLHHLPLDEVLPRMRRALRENGTLLVLDLYRADGPADLLTSALAMPLSLAMRVAHTGRLRPSADARAVWAAHGRNDTYLTVEAVRRSAAEALPGAHVHKHLFWRYSLVWRNGSHSAPAHP